MMGGAVPVLPGGPVQSPWQVSVPVVVGVADCPELVEERVPVPVSVGHEVVVVRVEQVVVVVVVGHEVEVVVVEQFPSEGVAVALL